MHIVIVAIEENLDLEIEHGRSLVTGDDLPPGIYHTAHSCKKMIFEKLKFCLHPCNC